MEERTRRRPEGTPPRELTPEERERRRRIRAKRAREAARRRRQRTMIFGAAALVLLVVLLVALLSRCGTGSAENPADTSIPTETMPTETQPDPSIREVGRATVAYTGDFLMHLPIIEGAARGNTYDFSGIFTYLARYVAPADYVACNLETTLAGADSQYPYSGYPHFNCPDEIVEGLRDAGFDLLLTANNHTYDTEDRGMTRTQEVIRKEGLKNLGTTLEDSEPRYLIRDLNGIKVGMICYTYGEYDKATGLPELNDAVVSKELGENINIFAYEDLNRFYREMEIQVAAMKADGAEAIVLFIHWGAEYITEPTSSQYAIAQQMCDLGVDVIAGGHPHVVQPIDILTSTKNPDHKTVCAYSVGNAVSNQLAVNMETMKTGHTEDGALVSFTFVKYSNGEVHLDSVKLLPTWVYIRPTDGGVDYNILPLDTTRKDWRRTLDIDDAAEAGARASFNRTMELMGDGMEKIRDYLDGERARREAAIAAYNAQFIQTEPAGSEP